MAGLMDTLNNAEPRDLFGGMMGSGDLFLAGLVGQTSFGSDMHIGDLVDDPSFPNLSHPSSPFAARGGAASATPCWPLPGPPPGAPLGRSATPCWPNPSPPPGAPLGDPATPCRPNPSPPPGSPLALVFTEGVMGSGPAHIGVSPFGGDTPQSRPMQHSAFPFGVDAPHWGDVELMISELEEMAEDVRHAPGQRWGSKKARSRLGRKPSGSPPFCGVAANAFSAQGARIPTGSPREEGPRAEPRFPHPQMSFPQSPLSTELTGDSIPSRKSAVDTASAPQACSPYARRNPLSRASHGVNGSPFAPRNPLARHPIGVTGGVSKARWRADAGAGAMRGMTSSRDAGVTPSRNAGVMPSRDAGPTGGPFGSGRGVGGLAGPLRSGGGRVPLNHVKKRQNVLSLLMTLFLEQFQSVDLSTAVCQLEDDELTYFNSCLESVNRNLEDDALVRDLQKLQPFADLPSLPPTEIASGYNNDWVPRLF